MRVITEDTLLKLLETTSDSNLRNIIFDLLEKCDEQVYEANDTLITNEPDVILAAEKYAEMYDGDDRQDIKTDVLNSFYHGAFFKRKNQGDTLTVSKLRPMSEAPRYGLFLGYYKGTVASYFEIMSYSKLTSYCEEFDEDAMLGWIPLPIYKPEK